MKQTACIFFLMAISLSMTAQNEGRKTDQNHKKRNILLDFQAGYSVPFGKYAGSDTTADLTGYATGGLFAQASITLLGRKNLGLSATYCYQRNPLQKGVEYIRPEGHSYMLGSRPWSNHYLLAGPAYSNKFGRFFIIAKVQVGVVLAFSSNFSITMPENQSDSTIPPTTYLSEGAGIGVAFQGLVSGGYQLTDKLVLNLNFSFLGANPVRKKDYYTSSYYYDEELKQWLLVWQGGEFIMKKKISTLNIGIGIAYRF